MVTTEQLCQKYLPPLRILLLCMISLCVLISIANCLVHVQPFSAHGQMVSPVREVTMTRGGQSESLVLPCTIRSLNPRETLKLEFTVTPDTEDSLYIKTVYAPLKVYTNGTLVYSYGDPGSYPSFFADPPTEVTAVPLPDQDGEVSVTLLYQAPTARTSMTLSPPLLGSGTAIIGHLLRTLGVPLLFAAVQIFMGIILILITFFLFPLDVRMTAPMWLGLFALSAGVWAFSESNLIVYLTGNPSLLYMLAFMGLFFLAIPLYHFAIKLLNLQKCLILQLICLIHELLFLAALVLQLTGLLPFSRSMYLFHLTIPGSFVFLTAYLLYLGIRRKDATLVHFSLLFSVLAISSVLETLNYRIRLINQLSSVFQAGILLFLILAEIQAGIFLKNTLALRERNRMLSSNLDMMEKQLDMEKERIALLLKNEESVRQQRHDMKHQYAILKTFCQAKEFTSLADYLNELTQNLPTDQTKTYCANAAVNAIVSYYTALAADHGITTTVHLDIPADLAALGDNSLCVIFGNLLENAIEACDSMTEADGERFIRIFSRILENSIYITMDNSFNGQVQMKDGAYLSHKRNEIGIGLLSIRSIAEKHGGMVKFKTDGKTFLSNVMVKF